MLHIIVPLDWLAVHPRAHPKRKNHSRGNIREPKGLIIASKSDDMGDHAEHWVVVYEEGIGFPALESAHYL